METLYLILFYISSSAISFCETMRYLEKEYFKEPLYVFIANKYISPLAAIGQHLRDIDRAQQKALYNALSFASLGPIALLIVLFHKGTLK